MPARLEFLYLGALIAIAAAMEGNYLALWLAVAAFVLTFVSVRIVRTEKPPRSSLFSPPLVRGEKRERPTSRMLDQPRRRSMRFIDNITTERGSNAVGVIACKVQDTCSEVVQTSVGMMVSSGKGRMGSDGVYVGCMGAIGAIIPTSMIVAEKPQLTKEEVMEKGRDIANSLVTKETILFTCLLTAHVVEEFTAEGQVTTAMNPVTLYAALQDWEKLTGKRAEDYLDNKMCAAAREAAADGSVSFANAVKRGSVPNTSSRLN